MYDEDVGMIGDHSMTGAPVALQEMPLRQLGEASAQVPVVGGALAAEDAPNLKALGVAEVYLPGASLGSLVGHLRRIAQAAPSF